jgi:hypothetical protein
VLKKVSNTNGLLYSFQIPEDVLRFLKKGVDSLGEAAFKNRTPKGHKHEYKEACFHTAQTEDRVFALDPAYLDTGENGCIWQDPAPIELRQFCSALREKNRSTLREKLAAVSVSRVFASACIHKNSKGACGKPFHMDGINGLLQLTVTLQGTRHLDIKSGSRKNTEHQLHQSPGTGYVGATHMLQHRARFEKDCSSQTIHFRLLLTSLEAKRLRGDAISKKVLRSVLQQFLLPSLADCENCAEVSR